MKKKVLLYGPDVSGESARSAYGGGTGGYTRNMLTLLNYFKSNKVILHPCYHTFRGQLKLDNFVWRMLVDSYTFFFALISYKPDAVHVLAQYRSAAPRELMVSFFCGLFKIPFLYEIKAGAFVQSYQNKNRVYRWIIRRLVRNAKYILCEGKLYLTFLSEEFNRSDAEYFPNVVPDELVPKVDNKILMDDAIRVLFVGYCYKGKGVMPLVEACSMVASEDINIQLTLVGEEHPEFSYWLDQFQKNAGLEIHRMGKRSYEEVLNEFGRHDVYCYPTSHSGEGHNNTINEALMSGLYVITTKQGFLADVITANRGASLNTAHAVEIAGALKWVAMNPVAASDKAKQGKRYLRENFRTSTNFSRLESIYLEMAR